MEDNKALLPVHKSMDTITLNERVDILLTPQFYIMKRAHLPVKYAFQAKAVAPSLFEGILEEGVKYDFFVFKEEDEWIFLAYSMDEVTSFLQSKGIGLENVSKLFFAQQIFHAFETPFALSQKDALGVLDATAVMLPRSAIGEERVNLSLPYGVKPKQGVAMQGMHSALFSRTQAYAFSAVFIFFAILFTVEGARYTANDVSEEALGAWFAKYPELESQYKRDSILQKYKNIDASQRRKREVIRQVGEMIVKGSKLSEMHLDDKGFSASFESADAKALNSIEMKAKGYGYTVLKESKSIKVEGIL